MKGLKVIPLFGFLIVLTYVGVSFVRQNPQDVVVKFGERATSPTALGFVILTSILGGMVFAGILCSLELMILYMENKKMRRKLFPRHPASTGGALGKKMTDEYTGDIDEGLRQSAEPRDETTGSHQP